jgi:T-complex protein 1 subunit theta
MNTSCYTFDFVLPTHDFHSFNFQDGRLLPGAGACEVELARQVEAYGETLPGLEQYSVKKYASALENFMKILAENSGRKSNEIIARIYAAHHKGMKNIGFNIDDSCPEGLIDVQETGIVDMFMGKTWALQYATQAACTILKVDQIIMAKRAGGVKPRDAKGPAQDDD